MTASPAQDAADGLRAHEEHVADSGRFPSAIQDRFTHVFYASHRTRSVIAAAVILVTLLGAWFVTYLAGGTESVAPQAFYVPILVAATRFRWHTAVLTAIGAGVLAGPASLLDVKASVAQSTGNWVGRLVVFVVIALLVSWLSHESRPAILRTVRDSRDARELRAGLARGELVVHYQPIFELDTEAIVGVEALVRWQHPQRGLVPPAAFIPLAERTGLIVPLEIFVLTEATQQTARWRAADSGCTPLTVAVNISATHLDDSDIVAHVAAALASSGLEPGHLCVEITETAMIRDFGSAFERVVELRRLGVQIALDDFGTGLSSLAYLQKLPIDIVKIDRSFVMEVDTDARSEAVISGIAMLAQAMGSSLVAEGIETQGQLDALRAIGCRRGQGFLVGRPVPAEELEARMSITPSGRSPLPGL